MVEPASGQDRPVSRSRRLLAGISALVLTSTLAIGLVSYDLLIRGNAIEPAIVELDGSTFDPDKLYTRPSETDMDHPNRIDSYGCLFSDCDSGDGDSILSKVRKLKTQLIKFAKLQKQFEETLDKPAQTTISVTAGEPGLTGRRGPRGAIGPRGYPGDTGLAGRPGHMGRPGKNGVEGPPGAPGMTGQQGDQGPTGPPGVRGPVGPRGPQGSEGPRGNSGPPGFPGANGVAGQPGQKGNKGPKGISAQGPAGPKGIVGGKGPTGDRGAEGNRGPPGPTGTPGGRGPPGLMGAVGQPGKDEKILPAGQCKANDMSGKNICCGQAKANWQSLTDMRAYMSVSTSSCLFSDNNVMYFTSLTGGIAMDVMGSSVITSSSSDSFTVRIDSPFTYGKQMSYGANKNDLTVQWCGVGTSTGSTVSAVCCGTDSPSDWTNSGYMATKEVNTRPCNMKGNPVYFAAMAVPSSEPIQNAVGTAGIFPGTGRPYQSFRTYLQDKAISSTCSSYSDGCRKSTVRDKVVASGEYKPQFCSFGMTFPNGDAMLLSDSIAKDEFPCQGIRMVDNAQVSTNHGKACCKVSTGSWQQKDGYISQTVDTSACDFEEYPTPVYLTSLIASAEGSTMTGLTGLSSNVDSTGKSFTVRIAGQTVNAQQSPGKIQWCGFGKKTGIGKTFGSPVGMWTISMYKSKTKLVCLPDPSVLTYVGKAKAKTINLNSAQEFMNAVPGTPDSMFVWIIDGKIMIESAGPYTICTTSDDGSFIYIDGALSVNDGALHGMVQKCSTTNLNVGGHTIQIRGWNNGGGAGEQVTYSGPDTKGQSIFMPSSITTGAMDVASGTGFCMCGFTSNWGPSSQPNWESADQGSGLYYQGQSMIPSVNFLSAAGFQKYMSNLPSSQFGWAIYGEVKIVTQGSYTFCIASDDGSKFYLDGTWTINNDGLHGLETRCATTQLSSGLHQTYIEGFNNQGAAAMKFTYGGPDTSDNQVLVRDGFACTPSTPGCTTPKWTMSIYSSKLKLVCLADPSVLTYVGKGTVATINFNSASDFRAVVPGTPDNYFLWVIDGKLKIGIAGTYSLCTTSDDGSYIYVDDKLTAEDPSVHGMVQRCGSVYLSTGDHTVQVQGFQGWGGVGEALTYSGPDTEGTSIPMPCGVTTDPAPQKGTGFTMCAFVTNWGPGSVPNFEMTDLNSGIYYRGQAQITTIDFQSSNDFRKYISNVPDNNFGWAVYGKAIIKIAGRYTFCITSDDGSLFYVDGSRVANDDGLHPMQQQCGSVQLSSGDHQTFVEGFQNGGATGMQVTYAGPDTDGTAVFLRSGVGCSPGQSGCSAPMWTMSIYTSKIRIVCLTEPSVLDFVGSGRVATVNFNSIQDFRNVVSGTPDNTFMWVIDGKVNIQKGGSYTICTTSDDGSYVYVDGQRTVNDGGLHGMVERCSSVSLGSGLHWIQVRGFQNYGGVGETLTYAGPDTSGNRNYMPCGATTGAVAQTATGFSMCTFTTNWGPGSMPNFEAADQNSGVYLHGMGQIQTVNFNNQGDFRRLIANVPDNNFGWVIYGQASIKIAGTYQFCIMSDDGSKLFIDGTWIINNDWLHGPENRCGNWYLSSGNHQTYVEGFQNGGGVGAGFTYSGPDTGGKTVYIRSKVTCTPGTC